MMLLSLPAYSLFRLTQALASCLLAAFCVFLFLWAAVGEQALGPVAGGSLTPSGPAHVSAWLGWLQHLMAVQVPDSVAGVRLTDWLLDRTGALLLMGLGLALAAFVLSLSVSLLEAYGLLPARHVLAFDLADYAAGRRQPPGLLSRVLQRGLVWVAALCQHGLLPLLAWLFLVSEIALDATDGLAGLTRAAFQSADWSVLSALALWAAWGAILLRSLMLWLEGLYRPSARQIRLLSRPQS